MSTPCIISVAITGSLPRRRDTGGTDHRRLGEAVRERWER
jgi:hypothetical protein